MNQGWNQGWRQRRGEKMNGERRVRDKKRERKGMQVSEEKRFWRLVRVREGNKSEGDKMGKDIPFTSGGVNLKTFRKKSGQKREHKKREDSALTISLPNYNFSDPTSGEGKRKLLPMTPLPQKKPRLQAWTYLKPPESKCSPRRERFFPFP